MIQTLFCHYRSKNASFFDIIRLMPRGRKKKFKLNLKLKPETARSFAALALILLSGLIAVSFFTQDYTLNSRIFKSVTVLFGAASFLFPIILLLLGLLLVQSINFKYKNFRVLMGLCVLLLVMSAFFHIFSDPDAAYSLAKSGGGGGLIGYKISYLLLSTVSIYGGLLILAAGFTASLIFILDISIDQIFSYLGTWNVILNKVKPAQKSTSVKKTSVKEDKLEISTNLGPFSEEEEIQEPVLKAHVEPSFEIIPSLSEPQSEDKIDPNIQKSSEALVSIASNLPYVDKVWENPPLDLLFEPGNSVPDAGDINSRAKIIKDTLKSFGINSEVADIQAGPSVTQYALEAEIGTKISKIVGLQYDLALALASPTGSVRIEAPIPGKSLVGIEVPNNTRALVNFKSLITSDSMKALKSKLGIVLGKDVSGQTRVYDIAKMPHLLVAGSTGSGKSVFLHSLIFSILYRASPQEVKFILIDPKRVELIHYQDMPHLYTPVVTDMDKAPAVFKWAVFEMERRYKLFESAKARNIEAYNEKSGFQALPYIVIIVDELGEIMVQDPSSVEKSIIRIAQLARATGIHLVLSVQRPSTNIITGLIKANIPCRVAFNVASQIDSRVIIDQPGAEKLLGKGDMLFVPPDVPKPTRLQGAFIADKEINTLVNYLKSTGVKPEYKTEIFDMSERSESKSISAGGSSVDELYDEAVEIVTSSGKASASLLQRRLSIGYARAARILDELEQNGIISSANGSKPREVITKGERSIGLDPLETAPESY